MSPTSANPCTPGSPTPATVASLNSAQIERGQVTPELGANVVAFECQLNRGLEPAHRSAGVISSSLERIGVHVLVRSHGRDAVRQLNLAQCAAGRFLQRVEDAWRQDVAADDRKVAGGIIG